MQNISTKALSGFMELSPAHQLEFERLKNIITETYATYGFTPLDTPTLERSEVLAAKVGAETQKQIYRFERGGHDLSLRFDLTVPLSRYVIEHRNDLVFPFRRQQISKVFRGERAQKGRYREFYQCDADIIGAGSLDIAYDSEIIALINETFTKLNLAKFQIRINNRKLVTGFLEALNVPDQDEIIALIDKSEKISAADLEKELDLLRLNALEKRIIIKFIATKGNFTAVKTFFDNLSAPTNDDITQGLSDLEKIATALAAMNIPTVNYIFDLAIVRGLDYYTGTIFETSFVDYAALGSICSGGRYDNLASVFSNQKMPGVGMSIGLTRLFSQLQEIGLINSVAKTISQVVVLPLTDNLPAVFATVAALRAGNVKVELYLETAKLDKKMKYAANLGVPYVILLGDDEVKDNRLTVKNMRTSEQENLSLTQAVDLLAS